VGLLFGSGGHDCDGPCSSFDFVWALGWALLIVALFVGIALLGVTYVLRALLRLSRRR
jgi:hypothetical protein